MKLHNKLSIGLILAFAILTLTISLVYAQPRPIGTTLQTNPYDSNPTVVASSGTTVNFESSMRDGRLTTSGFFTLAEFDAAGYVEFKTFDNPAALFTIGWVDIKIKYQNDPWAFDDTYNITYSTDGTNWVVLQSDTTSQFDSVGPSPQTRSWAEVAEPQDGSWSWTDVTSLRVRISFDPGGDGFADFNDMYVYEVWATVYEGPLPPMASPTISIQPPVVGTLAAGRRWFVEVYAQDVTNLAGYQFTINFNTTVLQPLFELSYYPFTDQAVSTLNDTGGYVSLAYSIPISDPLSGTGVTGNFSLARIYFRVDAGMTASDWSLLSFSVSILGDNAAQPMAHSEYHGIYGSPPPEMHIGSWIPASPFPYGNPISTHWVELWPDAGVEWHLTSWDDNGDSTLDPSDQIDMTMTEPPDPSQVYWFHVDEIWESDADPRFYVYMILTFKYTEPVPEFPLGLGLTMILALLIPTAYLWRLRKKGTKQ